MTPNSSKIDKQTYVSLGLVVVVILAIAGGLIKYGGLTERVSAIETNQAQSVPIAQFQMLVDSINSFDKRVDGRFDTLEKDIKELLKK